MTGYAGWVPTITGQLSFSLIGLRAGNPGYITANRPDSSASQTPHRTIVVVKRRVTRDVPAPVRWFHPQRIKTCVLLGKTSEGDRPYLSTSSVTAVTDEIGELSGCVLVIPFHRNDLLRRLAKKCVREVTRLVSSLPERDSAEALYQAIIDRIATSERAGVKVLKCEFQLYRTGEIRVQTDASVRPELAQQMYYFVKDCAHRHYHHDTSTDNLLPLSPAPLSDDVSWRRHTLWCLTRSVLEARRRDSLKGYKSALGMLAYADAFQALLGQVHRPNLLPEKYARIPGDIRYDFAHTKSSLEAKIAEKEYSSGSTRDVINIIVASGIGLTALWIAAVQINREVCSAVRNIDQCTILPPAYLAELVSYIIQNPINVFGVIVLLSSTLFYRKIMNAPWIAKCRAFIESWSQATGATISRLVLPRSPSGADIVGAWGAAMVAVALGGLLISIVALVRAALIAGIN